MEANDCGIGVFAGHRQHDWWSVVYKIYDWCYLRASEYVFVEQHADLFRDTFAKRVWSIIQDHRQCILLRTKSIVWCSDTFTSVQGAEERYDHARLIYTETTARFQTECTTVKVDSNHLVASCELREWSRVVCSTRVFYMYFWVQSVKVNVMYSLNWLHVYSLLMIYTNP